MLPFLKLWFLPLLTLFIAEKCAGLNFNQENVTLTIGQGTLMGEKTTNMYDKQVFYTFQGIPYAKPPIGALRFRAPEPAESWDGVYDATKVRAMCPQTVAEGLSEIFALDGLENNEDCLFLTVHTKMSDKPKPVMFWIHGGGYTYGSVFEDNYGPELLMTEDIVLVKIAYRLNIFGFLSIDDPKYDIPGNAGLKDQVLALKWVQKNIHHFGGDPNQVTIFGESAGGASIHYLMISPLAKGLFHRGISQSGAPDSAWLTSPNKYPELAQALKCNSKQLDKIVNCINGSTTDALMNAFDTISNSPELNKRLKNGEIMKFNCLTIEKNLPGSFLPDTPENIIKSGKVNNVPLMAGFNTDEGEIVAFKNTIQPNLTDYRELIPKDIKIDLESEEAYRLGNKIKDFYYGDKKVSTDSLDNFIDFLTDSLILQKVYKFAKLQSNFKKNPVYFYEFDLYTPLNLHYQSNSSKTIVTHFDDVRYLFYRKNITPGYLDPKSKEYMGIHRMVKLWTTFATSLNANPNPVNDPLINVQWLPFETNKQNYLKISDKLESKENPYEKRMQFWEEIYSHYAETHPRICDTSSDDLQCSNLAK